MLKRMSIYDIIRYVFMQLHYISKFHEILFSMREDKQQRRSMIENGKKNIFFLSREKLYYLPCQRRISINCQVETKSILLNDKMLGLQSCSINSH